MFLYSTFIPPEQEPFMSWLLNNESLVRQGAAAYEGQRVTLESKLVRYECVVSALLYTGRSCSPLMLAESDDARSTFLRMTGMTLALGWWAVLGFIFAPLALYTNLVKRGDKGTVSEFLEIVHNPGAAMKSDAWSSYVASPLLAMGMLFFLVIAIFGAMFAQKFIGH